MQDHTRAKQALSGYLTAVHELIENLDTQKIVKLEQLTEAIKHATKTINTQDNQ